MTDKKKVIRWFDNIAEECDKLTSGNVAHLRTQIKGMAIRSAEYLKKQESTSKNLEKESDIMAIKLFKEFFPQDGDTITPNDFCKGLRSFAYHFTQWQKEQMVKDAVEGLIADYYLDVIKLRRSLPNDKYKAFRSVKLLIIKE